MVTAKARTRVRLNERIKAKTRVTTKVKSI